MKSLVKILLLFALCVAAQAQESQLFGTRAFLSLPKSYSYAYEQLGYVDPDSGAIITATRVRVGLSALRRNIEQSGAVPVLDTPQGKIYPLEHPGPSGDLRAYALLIGDETESATVSAIAPDATDSTKSRIFQLLQTAKWVAGTDLNFEKASFFQVDHLDGLAPLTTLGNSILFTPDGAQSDQVKMGLRIGRFPLLIDPAGREREIIDFIANPTGAAQKVKSQRYETINVGGMAGIMLIRSYEGQGEEVESRVTALFSDAKVIVIDAESRSREYAKYLDSYERIVRSLKVKLNN